LLLLWFFGSPVGLSGRPVPAAWECPWGLLYVPETPCGPRSEACSAADSFSAPEVLVLAKVLFAPLTSMGVEFLLPDWKAEDSAARESEAMGPGFSRAMLVCSSTWVVD
jgi:hypothetical protein